MSRAAVLLAQLDPKEMGGYWQRTNISKAGLGTVIGAISAVVVIVIIWAIFIRKPGRDRPRGYRYPRLSDAESSQDGERNGSSQNHSRRKRRRRREHRLRKPTLSETGGLPPVRGDVPSDDPP